MKAPQWSEGYTLKLKLSKEAYKEGRLNDLIVVKGLKLNKVYKCTVYYRENTLPCVKISVKVDKNEGLGLFYNDKFEVWNYWDLVHPNFYRVKVNIESKLIKALKKPVEFMCRLLGEEIDE